VAPDPFWNSVKITPFWNSVKIKLFPVRERTSNFSAHGLVITPCMKSRLLAWLVVPKTAEVTGDWIKLNSNEFQNPYFSLNIFRTRISR
jgi:hypothetical protein